MAKSRLHELAARGQSIWFDTLSRDLVHSGELKRMMDEDAVTGVTSNPTIFQKALSSGSAYDEDMKKLLGQTDDPEQIFFSLALQDIRDACDVLKPAFDASGGVDGFVSMEVLPGLAYDTEGTFAQAQWISKEVERPNLYVKIPATMAGLPAIEDSIAHGTSINITLIFSLERYKAVVEAYLRGLERLIAGGGDPSKVASVASFFVSRVDTEVDKRLEKIGSEEALALRGKAGVANARLAYAAYEEVFVGGSRYEALKADGPRVQRPLWASTGVKNPEYSDTLYVTELVAPNTVNTMPEKTIDAVADHGVIAGDAVTGKAEESQALFDELAAVGIDLPDVLKVLEDEGVEKFDKSWLELLDATQAQLDAAKK